MLGWSLPSLSFGRSSDKKGNASESSPVSDAAGPSRKAGKFHDLEELFIADKENSHEVTYGSLLLLKIKFK